MRTFAEYRKAYLAEGGNVVVGGNKADKIDIRKIDRQVLVKELGDMFRTLNAMFAKRYKRPIWKNEELLSGEAFNGSSEYLFSPKVKTDFLLQHKPTFGDLDVTVPAELKSELGQLLDDLQGKNITANSKYLGANKDTAGDDGSHQFNTIIQFTGLSKEVPSLNVQVDFELTEYEEDRPSQFAKFAHSSHVDDLAKGLKGVTHKFILTGLVHANSLLAPDNVTFLTKASTAEKYKVAASKALDGGKSKYAFSVDRGLRQRMIPVMDPKTGKQLEVDGKPAWKERDTDESEFVTKVDDIARHIFGDQFDPKDSPKLWSTVGLLELMDKYSSRGQIQAAFDKMVDKSFGYGAQHINQTPEEDQKVKMAAWSAMVSKFPFINETEAKKKFEKYYGGFEERQAAMSKRKGVV